MLSRPPLFCHGPSSAQLLSKRMCHTTSACLKGMPSSAEQPGAQPASPAPSVRHPTTDDDCRIETSVAGASPINRRPFLGQRGTRSRRHRSRHRGRGQALCHSALSAALQPCTSFTGQGLTGIRARAGEDFQSRDRLSRSTAAPSRHPAAAYRLSALESTLHQHIRCGAWMTALELLQKEKGDLPAPGVTAVSHALQLSTTNTSSASTREHATNRRSAAPTCEYQSSNRPPPISLGEQCVWSLLWCGQEAAAWRTWQWMQSQGSPGFPAALHGVEATAVAPAVCAPSPRLLLILALFLHFAAQDRPRSQGVLLLLEVMWKTRGSVVDGSQSPSPASETLASSRSPSKLGSSCASLSCDATAAQWIPLFSAWLRCLGSGTAAQTANRDVLPQSYSSFYGAALHRMASCIEEKRANKATVVALLLLSAYENWPTPLDARNAETAVVDVFRSPLKSRSPLSSAASVETVELVEAEFWSCARKLRAERRGSPKRAQCSVSVNAPVRSFECPEKERAHAQEPLRRQIRGAFAAAACHLSRQCDSHAQSNKNDLAHPNESRRPACSPAYKFWFQQLMDVLDCADLWTALVNTSEGSIAAIKRMESISDGSTPSSSARLQKINEATDTKDWEAALRLCLFHPSDGHAGSQLPWLRLLRKGLTACEAAAKTDRGVPWQGALALWRFAQAHSGDDSAAVNLTWEHGRIFMLLASATRWSEALRCFHATPTHCLDGFVVAQVGYALRASAAHLDRAVLDLWAAWRCRVGDSVEPREEAVVQLLQAMLHMSSPSSLGRRPALTTTWSSRASAAANTDDAAEVFSTVKPPAEVITSVATELLKAAAATSTPPLRVSGTDVKGAGDAALRLPGTRVPLDWRRHRHLVRRILENRWTGGWVEALRVAVASGDVSLLRSVAPRVPRSHLPALYEGTVRSLRERGVELTAGDRATLWALWEGAEGVRRDNVPRLRRHGRGACRRISSSGVLEKGVDVAQVTQNAESLLNVLLGAEEEPWEAT
ncbi:hypothetical protein ABL78_5962 [Leptomonas seymouri]|uniref:Uncharacterized protein n=1 Tax=Leptomonas seymouri TaxID=5684 RepID=A0A0N0P483_LEPSE|nr:hypothetical protein ABL78_5962 [Leptomonas seymouri]|eukprot:KPI84996.1 hypothetical protein ABL78_5962 [Leptomonas seymouri]